MPKLVTALVVLSVVSIGAAVYWLTLDASQADPCLAPKNDTTAAILGSDDDQAGLANRAMLQKQLCDKQRAKLQ